MGFWGCGRGLVKGCWREGEGVSLRWRGCWWVDLLFVCTCRGCLLAACWVAFGSFRTSFFRLGLFGFGPLAFFWLATLGGGEWDARLGSRRLCWVLVAVLDFLLS